MNCLKKEFRTKIGSKSGKPLKSIIKKMGKAYLRPVLFWDQVKFLYRSERKVQFEVRVKVKLQLQLHILTADHPPRIHGYGSIKFTDSRRVATPIEKPEGNPQDETPHYHDVPTKAR